MTEEKLTFDGAIELAESCKNYCGGYDGFFLEIYHHGMDTVIRCFEEVKKQRGITDAKIIAEKAIAAPQEMSAAAYLEMLDAEGVR